MNNSMALIRIIRKKISLIYKIHIWTGLLSAIGLLILCVTGIILLGRSPLYQWNSMGVKLPAEKCYSSEEIWDNLTDGLGEVDRHFPGVSVLEAVADTKYGLLKFKLENRTEGTTGSKGKQKKAADLVNYDVDLRTVSTPVMPVYRSEILRGLLQYAKKTHTGTALDYWLKPIWVFMLVISMVAIISGFLFHGFACNGPLGRITLLKKSKRWFWSDVHRLTGVLTGSFLFVMSASGILLTTVPSDFGLELKDHEIQAKEYFSRIDKEYGEVYSNFKVLPSEALRRLRERFPADKYRLLSIKFPAQGKEFYSFYLTESPFGNIRNNAVELVCMRPDGENLFVVTPSPASRLIAYVAQFHKTWSMNGGLGLMWFVYLIFSILMVISGLLVHVRRNQGTGGYPDTEKKPTSIDRFQLPAFITIIVILSFALTRFDESGSLAAAGLLIPVLVAGLKVRKVNKRKL